ncbi:MAG: 2-C-methyl-D-erythritol 2,4-cyclodiphosphate synthase [Phycisphaerales bacterium]|nr:2-C-methyl-D-erythritol 2,4-cyclodiphosphate synthase [Phycisphaerales bacterium]
MTGGARVGIGYDIHRLVSDRPLILGGVRVEYERGLLGHSDGDAVLHALIDAMLGAAGLGDIGELFPDTEELYAGADSRVLTRDVVKRVGAAGWTPSNVDIIVHAERPKLSAYKQAMAESVAGLLGIDGARVNVKAKTNEGLGPVGRREGIACTAVVLLTSSLG